MTRDEILQAMENCNFTNLTSDNFEYKIIENIKPCLVKDFQHGATKGVIFFTDTDFVVKIPFSGMEAEIEEYDEENDKYTADYVYSSFTAAGDQEIGNDYCKAEMVIYDTISQNYPEITSMFMQISFLGYVNSYPIYFQPICTIFDYERRSAPLSKERQSYTTSFCEKQDRYCFNATWLSDAMDIYGEEVVTIFLDALENESIQDLHSGNLGYFNHCPVLVDYGGYHEN